MKEKFMITIESFHYADRGTQNNVSERNEVVKITAIMLAIIYAKGFLFFMCELLGVDVISSCLKT